MKKIIESALAKLFPVQPKYFKVRSFWDSINKQKTEVTELDSALVIQSLRRRE